MKGKRWTKEEEEFLAKWWGKKDRNEIAKALGKSFSAVQGKVIRMKLGTFRESSELMILKEATEITGIDPKTFTQVWSKKGFKTTQKKAYVMVDEKDLLSFMKSHQDLWDARKCDYWYFHSYSWFLAKLKADRENPPRKKEGWSEKEVSQLKGLYRAGMTYPNIAKRLGRPYKSAASKLRRIDRWS